jgi:hypothetical protein
MASPEIQNLAHQLLALEAAPDPTLDVCGGAAVRVIEKLRLRLIRLAGVAGFRSLLSRALALAKVEVPSLHLVHIDEDGLLDGFAVIASSQDVDVMGADVAGQARNG